MVPPDVLSPATLVAGRYRVVRELGRGGMGAVYLVEHVHTGEHLALKLLVANDSSDEAIQRFKREARASARIRTENVVRVTDADVASDLGGASFLVMELLEGYGVDELLRARGKIDAGEALAIVAQLASALDKAHALGIIHRDIKPANLFVHRRHDGSAILKVLDFGISKVLPREGSAQAAGSSTTTGVVMGTPQYMAPEQARGQPSKIGAATDVWAIGMLAVRLLTGESYWRVEGMGDLIAHIIAMPIEAPSARWPQLPAAFDAWFLRSCAREPGERFASAGQQVEELARALGVAAIPALTLDPALVRALPPPASIRGGNDAATPSIEPAPRSAETTKTAKPVHLGVRGAPGTRFETPAARRPRRFAWIGVAIAGVALASVATWTVVRANRSPAAPPSSAAAPSTNESFVFDVTDEQGQPHHFGGARGYLAESKQATQVLASMTDSQLMVMTNVTLGGGTAQLTLTIDKAQLSVGVHTLSNPSIAKLYFTVPPEGFSSSSYAEGIMAGQIGTLTLTTFEARAGKRMIGTFEADLRAGQLADGARVHVRAQFDFVL
jgi:serine/threonine-protein kinase